MPFTIQRNPKSLGSLLSTFGGETPRVMADQVYAGVDLLQFYGGQRQLAQINNGTLAQGQSLPAGSSIMPPNVPFVLYGASLSITRTATMTNLGLSIWIGIGNTGYAVASAEFQRFGATALGVAKLSWYAPYPIVLPAGTSVFSTLDMLGTDATANAGFSVDHCPLG